MLDDVAYPPRTSLPRWGITPPPLRTTAAEYTVFSLGSADDATARAWGADLTAANVGHAMVRIDAEHLLPWIDQCAMEFGRIAATKRVGWHVAAAGEEVGVLAVLAAARQVGLIDAEITVFAETQDLRNVFCPHCKTTTLAICQPGDALECDACLRTLVVRSHLARELGSYLGVGEP